ncbi:MAG: iron ABC transporter permease [bacterium]
MKYPHKLLLIILLFVLAVVCSFYIGATKIPLHAIFSAEFRPIVNLRITRILLGILYGAGLGVCGVVLQAILRNPLAEPYLLGTSSGAGFGAVVAIMLGINSAYLPAGAFIGALVTFILIYNLAKEGESIPVHSLILFGVITAMALSGLIIFFISLSRNQAMNGMMWWLLGNLQVYDYRLLGVAGTIVVAGIIVLFVFAQDLNAFSLGEEEAVHLGIDIIRVKKILFIIVSLITGALVSVAGMIGFVGLIMPHMARLLVGPNHKTLIPATVLLSAAFLIICDTIARSIMPPVEIPIGVITSLVGSPIFIYLLKRKRKM